MNYQVLWQLEKKKTDDEKKKVEQLNRENEKLSTKIIELNGELNGLKANLQTQQQVISAVRSESKQNCTQLQSKCDDLSQENQKLHNKLQEGTERSKKELASRNEIARLEDALQDARSTNNKAQQQIEQLEKAKNDMAKTMSELVERNSQGTDEETRNLREQNQVLQQKFTALEEDFRESKKQLNSSPETAETDKKALQYNYDQLVKEFQDQEEKYGELQQSLEHKIEKAGNELKRSSTSLRTLQNRFLDLLTELTAKEVVLVDYPSELHYIHEDDRLTSFIEKFGWDSLFKILRVEGFSSKFKGLIEKMCEMYAVKVEGSDPEVLFDKIHQKARLQTVTSFESRYSENILTNTRVLLVRCADDDTLYIMVHNGNLKDHFIFDSASMPAIRGNYMISGIVQRVTKLKDSLGDKLGDWIQSFGDQKIWSIEIARSGIEVVAESLPKVKCRALCLDNPRDISNQELPTPKQVTQAFDLPMPKVQRDNQYYTIPTFTNVQKPAQGQNTLPTKPRSKIKILD